MARTAITRDGDTADLLALAAYGATAGVTEALLDANPALAGLGPVYPAGLVVTLPEAAPAAPSPFVKLWD